MSARTLPEDKKMEYAIALQRAIEHHCRGEEVPPEIAVECPHHARMLNDHRAGALQAQNPRPCICVAARDWLRSDTAFADCPDCHGSGVVTLEAGK
jgi:hypothetical protein